MAALHRAGPPARRGFPHAAGRQRLLLLVCLGLLTTLAACRDEQGSASSEDAPGSFEVDVRGAFQNTLHGTATARLDTAGRLAGLELEAAGDTSRAGFSFELEPQPWGSGPAKRLPVYTVAARRQGREDTSFALMNAYMRLRGYAFTAYAGSLHVSRDSAGGRGAFALQLRGVVDAASDEPATVSARGQFDGAPATGAHP